MKFLRSRLFRAIASIGVAALIYFLCPPCFNRMYLLGVLALLVILINFSNFFGRFRWLTHITRIAVGGLFIFSGFIKANDPVGFSYKLEEYFGVFGQGFSCDMQVVGEGKTKIPCEEEAIKKKEEDKKRAYEESMKAANPNWTPPPPPAPEESALKGMYDFFAEHSLFLAIFICGFEIALGIFLLLGIQVRWVLFLLLAMIVFFSFLTFYSACCNKVTSCGCFGDAIKLTPWESFWKDLILLILITILFVGEQNIQPLFRNRIVLAAVAGIGLFLSFAFPVYTWRHLPLIDFRPYKIGTNLYVASHEKDPATTGCVQDSVVMEFYYYHNNDSLGPYRGFRVDSLPDSTWSYFCRHDKKVREGNCTPTVLDFGITDFSTNENITDSLLLLKGVQYFLVMYDLDKTDREVMGDVNEFYQACAKNGIPFNALAGATAEQMATFRTQTGAKYPMYFVDPTALKTVIRSNPGLVMLKDGVVTEMWHFNDFPAYSDAMQK